MLWTHAPPPCRCETLAGQSFLQGKDKTMHRNFLKLYTDAIYFEDELKQMPEMSSKISNKCWKQREAHRVLFCHCQTYLSFHMEIRRPFSPA